jgi:hypothetical protein
MSLACRFRYQVRSPTFTLRIVVGRWPKFGVLSSHFQCQDGLSFKPGCDLSLLSVLDQLKFRHKSRFFQSFSQAKGAFSLAIFLEETAVLLHFQNACWLGALDSLHRPI